MIHPVVPRIFYVIGIVLMLIPLLSGRPELKRFLIPAGIIISIIGFFLMGEIVNKKNNKNILDDGEF